MRSLVTIGGLLLALAPLLPALSQDLLFGRKAPQRPHVTWKVTVEPSTTTPGGRVEVVARYATLKGWHIYAPDHKGTGIASRISVRSEFLKAQGDPRFPQPETKEDKILEETHRLLSGKGEIRQTFVVSEKTPAGRLRFQALLDYMSCDAQSCDPPKKGEPQSLTLEVAAASVGLAPAAGVAKPAADAEGEKPGAAKERGLFFPGGLKAPGASRKKHAHFQVTVEPATLRRGQRAEIVVEYETTKGYYIYAPDQDVSQGGVRTVVLVDSPDITLSGEPTFPAPKVKEIVGLTSRTLSSEDPGEHKIRQPFHVKPEAPPGELKFRVTVPFMTCFSGGCDLPDEHVEDLVVQVTDEEPIAVQAPPAQGADEERIALGSIWLLILAMIGGGLLALVMPCTYPMIPITIGYFTNLAASRKGGVFHLALAYGAGIILSFNIIGWVFASSIVNFSSNAWVNLVFGIAFLAFALSFLGLFNLTLPRSVNNLASRASGTSSFLGVFALGATLVVTSFACTGPIMGTLLVVAGTGESLGRVTAGMTAFGATMAAPFVLLALFPARARSIPRAGEWMHTIKVFLGFVLLTTCLIFFSKADSVWGLGWLPREPVLLIWAAIFAALGLYLLGIFRLKDEEAKASGIGAFRMLLGIACVAAALYFHLGTLGFRLDWITESMAPSYSLPRLQAAAPGSPESWPLVKDDLDEGLALAKAKGLKALVNFTGFA